MRLMIPQFITICIWTQTEYLFLLWSAILLLSATLDGQVFKAKHPIFERYKLFTEYFLY